MEKNVVHKLLLEGGLPFGVVAHGNATGRTRGLDDIVHHGWFGVLNGRTYWMPA